MSSCWLWKWVTNASRRRMSQQQSIDSRAPQKVLPSHFGGSPPKTLDSSAQSFHWFQQSWCLYEALCCSGTGHWHWGDSEMHASALIWVNNSHSSYPKTTFFQNQWKISQILKYFNGFADFLTSFFFMVSQEPSQKSCWSCVCGPLSQRSDLPAMLLECQPTGSMNVACTANHWDFLNVSRIFKTLPQIFQAQSLIAIGLSMVLSWQQLRATRFHWGNRIRQTSRRWMLCDAWPTCDMTLNECSIVSRGLSITKIVLGRCPKAYHPWKRRIFRPWPWGNAFFRSWFVVKNCLQLGRGHGEVLLRDYNLHSL